MAFKAEYRKSDKILIESGRSLMKNSGVDLVVANDIGRKESEFGSEKTEVILIGRKVTHLGLDTKPKIAARILDEISERII